MDERELEGETACSCSLERYFVSATPSPALLQPALCTTLHLHFALALARAL